MKYFIKKIITLIITLLFISLLTFTAFSVIPGDAAISKLEWMISRSYCQGQSRV